MFQNISLTLHEPRDEPFTGITVGPIRHYGVQHTGATFFTRDVYVGGTVVTVMASSAEALKLSVDAVVKEV